MRRKLLTGVGLLSTSTGSILLITPVSLTVSLPTLPLLGGIGATILLLGSVAIHDDSYLPHQSTTLDDPAVHGTPTPGDALDERLASLSTRADETERDAIRQRLQSAAATVLAETNGCSLQEADERVTAGAWPTDERASAFFTDAPPTVTERVATVVTGEPTFARRARHVVTVLAEQGEES